MSSMMVKLITLVMHTMVVVDIMQEEVYMEGIITQAIMVGTIALDILGDQDVSEKL